MTACQLTISNVSVMSFWYIYKFHANDMAAFLLNNTIYCAVCKTLNKE